MSTDVRIHPHAAERLIERGATEAEIVATVAEGETFPAKFGRTGFRRNFTYNAEWLGRRYQTKQVNAYAVQEQGSWLVLTVITKYFEGPPMTLTYDPRHNIAYIRLREQRAQVQTIMVSDELAIDIAPDGQVYGIEFLNASEQLTGSDTLTVINEALGTSTEIKLAG